MPKIHEFEANCPYCKERFTDAAACLRPAVRHTYISICPRCGNDVRASYPCKNPGRPKGSGEGRTVSIPRVRVTPTEAAWVRERAALVGLTVSSYLRWLIQQEMKR